jgi:2-desacetyl-2-hydroxyethyl bacteriochlorophyllide A dehydrogenase
VKALLIDRPGHARLVAVAEPEPAADEVLLRVRTVGLCGSDLNTFRGLNPLVSYPRVPGHEVAATVERVGSAVPAARFPAGLNVTAMPYTSCGGCAACRSGRVNACRNNQTLGVQRDGAITEWIAVPWQNVLSADGLSLRALALVEPLSVGFHAVARARVAAGDTVAVIGCGAVGIGAVAGAARRGATVIAVDVEDSKLELARRAGAIYGVNSRTDRLHDGLRRLTNGEGPDIVIEAVGHPETFLSAVGAVAFAGRVVYIGYVRSPVCYDTTQFVKKELDILGSRNAREADFRAVIAHVRDGGLPIDDLVTRVAPIDEAGDALVRWAADAALVTRIHIIVDPATVDHASDTPAPR